MYPSRDKADRFVDVVDALLVLLNGLLISLFGLFHFLYLFSNSLLLSLLLIGRFILLGQLVDLNLQLPILMLEFFHLFAHR